MKDFLEVLERYKDFKDIQDLLDEIKELRELYFTQKFEKMMEHINKLMEKYAVETIIWNFTNPVMPQTYEQQYINAEKFLNTQGVKILTEKGIKIIQQS